MKEAFGKVFTESQSSMKTHIQERKPEIMEKKKQFIVTVIVCSLSVLTVVFLYATYQNIFQMLSYDCTFFK